MQNPLQRIGLTHEEQKVVAVALLLLLVGLGVKTWRQYQPPPEPQGPSELKIHVKD